jgi:hypothetical protein
MKISRSGRGWNQDGRLSRGGCVLVTICNENADFSISCIQS